MDTYAITPVERFAHGKVGKVEDGVIVEQPVSLTVNGKVWLTFMCSPSDLEALAVGFLFNENVIASKQDLADVYVCKNGENIDVWLTKPVDEPRNWRRTSGCTGGYTAAVLDEINPVRSNKLNISPEDVLRLVRQLFEAQEIYRKSGGVHSSALSDGENLIFQVEDVGRHNTLDKIAGKIILEDLIVDPKVILTTGRISSEMLQKAARLDAAVLISRTSPTSMSVELAERLGVTLIGYARGHRLNVYAHPERVDFAAIIE